MFNIYRNLLLTFLIGIFYLTNYIRASQYDNNEDYDDMRVSHSFAQGPINYQNAESSNNTQQAQRVKKISSQFGRPVVALLQQRQPINRLFGIDPTEDPQVVEQKRKLIDQLLRSSQIGKSNNVQLAHLQKQQTINKACQWKTLKDFKNISLETSDIIIKDSEERPCYILTLRAFIRWDDDAYYPLNNLKSYPQNNKIVLENPSDGATVQRPMNCSYVAGSSFGPTNGLLMSPDGNYYFLKEEITLTTECGYLVLITNIDGHSMILKSLSFYRNTDITDLAMQVNHNPRKEMTKVISPQMKQENLVFTTKGVNSPLLSIPLASRFACQNRVVLESRTSVQLILDRFELQRLSHSPSKIYHRSKEVTSNGELGLMNHNDNNAHQASLVDKRSAFYEMSKNPVTWETRCPNPVRPGVHLNILMDVSNLKRGNGSISPVIRSRWAQASSSTRSSSQKMVPQQYLSFITLLKLVSILCSFRGLFQNTNLWIL